MNEEFRILLARIQRKLWLERWTINLRFVSNGDMDDEWATIACPPHTHQAVLTVNEDLLSQPLSKQAEIIIHELLHVCLQQLTDVVKYGLEQAGVAPAAGAALFEAYRQQNELLCDRLARALEPSLR